MEEMLNCPDYDEDLQYELSTAYPNYMTVFFTAKRDLSRNDYGIVVIGWSNNHVWSSLLSFFHEVQFLNILFNKAEK